MALQKTKLRYIPLKCQRTALQECLDTRPFDRRRRCYRNCILLFMLVIVLHYSYTYYQFSDEIDSPFGESIDNVDEYLTTKSYDEEDLMREVHTYAFKTDNHMRHYNGSPYRTRSARSKLPRCITVKRFGRTTLNTSKINLSDLEKLYPMVEDGGFYRPPNCSTRQEVAIIVAYRGRETNLGIFLYNMHPILMAQQLEYQIFIIEQHGNELFNKGRLLNVGFKEVVKLNKFHCIVFHDLDLLPSYLEILYSCPTLPRHMSSQIDNKLVKRLGQKYKYKSLFGGVVSMTVEMVARANGYSNVYFGWGGEDNDMFWRLRAAGYPIVRYNKTIGLYTVLPHTRAPMNKFRHHLLVRAVERYKVDGLSNLEYVIISKTSYHLYTHIVADINPRKQNVTALTLRWASGDNAF